MQDNLQSPLEPQNNFLNTREPAFCCFEISSRCILKCRMCDIWKNKWESSESPTLTEWRNFIATFANLNKWPPVINFSGAEPLLDDRNLALAAFCAKKGISTSMCTNGFLIDKIMAHKIVESGLKVIIISLDGDKNMHDFLRGVDGCYDRVMQAINFLHACRADFEIGVQPIILGCNLNEIIALTEWINEDKRISFIHFQAVSQPFEQPFDKQWYKKNEYMLLWPQNFLQAKSTIDELIKRKNKGYKISNTVSQLETFKRYFANPQEFIRKIGCNVDFFMNINQFGDIFMCRLKDSIGNIKKASYKDIWYSRKAYQVREEIRNCKLNCHILMNCCYEEE